MWRHVTQFIFSDFWACVPTVVKVSWNLRKTKFRMRDTVALLLLDKNTHSGIKQFFSKFSSNKSPTRCNSFPVYYPDVYLHYGSTCFGCSPARHRELNDCSRSLWFYLRIVVIAVPCSWSGRLSPRYEGKTRGCYCSHRAPDDGWENAQNMMSCK